MDLTESQLLQIALDTAEAARSELRPALEQRVMAGIQNERKPLQHLAWGQAGSRYVSSLAAFIKTAAELADLIESLAPGEWTTITQLDGARVRDLVVHLVGVERYVLGQLGRRPSLEAPRREDHWPVTTLAAAELTNEPAAILAKSWWLEVLNVIAACGELGPDWEVSYHHLTGPTRGLLVVRTFELWTHGDDIRRATHRPLDRLDEARLSLMVNQLMTVLPLGLALSGCPQPGRTARLNLTGQGGGGFDVALAPMSPTGVPDITLTAAAVDFCRLASNRLTLDELDILVEGEAWLLDPILAGATAFSAD
jgi:uncharacterized protein (TIGR03083 family)